MPWNAVGYFTMWLQTLGFSDVPAGALTALFWGGTALGNLLGGIVGDVLAKRLPNVGRQLTCQVRTKDAPTACPKHVRPYLSAETRGGQGSVLQGR